MTTDVMRDLERFTAMLRRERTAFREQLDEVEKRYPLVMLALKADRVLIEELTGPRRPTGTLGAEILIALDEGLVPETERTLEDSTRYKTLVRCLQRAETYQDGLACF